MCLVKKVNYLPFHTIRAQDGFLYLRQKKGSLVNARKKVWGKVLFSLSSHSVQGGVSQNTLGWWGVYSSMHLGGGVCIPACTWVVGCVSQHAFGQGGCGQGVDGKG